jgi:predicted signal transduction protein with EAL and GGDEF domain
MSRPLRVLLVEDSEVDALLIVLELECAGYSPSYQRVDTAEDMQTALDTREWDVILADYFMPRFSAPEALQLLQDKQVDIPFIIISGSVGEETAVAAMKAGAHDYLLKGNLTRLAPTIEREIREVRVRAERKQAFRTIQHLAFYDSLTSLPNRASFLNALQQCIDITAVFPTAPFAVMLIDIDRYQTIKYSLGHVVGEKLLIAITRRLKACMRSNDILARVGTDEFAILLKDLDNCQLECDEPSTDWLQEMGNTSNGHQNTPFCNCTVTNRCDRIHKSFAAPFELEGSVVFSSVSIGVALSRLGFKQAEDFLRAADTANHHARLQGRNKTAVFNLEMQAHAIARLELETDLQKAIQQQQLYLDYQPIVSLQTNSLKAVEALVRWYHPQRGMVSSAKFVPLAEETGLIISLGQRVLQEACEQLHYWQACHAQNCPCIHVNLSARQLAQPGLIQEIDRLFAQFNLDGSYLGLEITESVLMENAADAMATLAQLKERQIKVSVDDFGTGYSSLSYLTNLPIDALKIDRSFIIRMTEDEKNFNVVKAIMTLADSLGLDVVAEGVETEEQADLLRSLGCEYGQGYLFAPPLRPEEVVERYSLTRRQVEI